MVAPPATRQNADLTFKLNRYHGRHGWLRLTPAYSVKLVTGILARTDRGIRVLDPFSGTGTTPLCAAYAGCRGCGVEINPFLTWLGNAKLAAYDADVLHAAGEALDQAVNRAVREDSRSVAPPPMHNLPRWWDPRRLDFLCRFKAALDDVAPGDGAVRNLLLVVFCRVVINLSNAAFNHQSMSFKDKVGAGATRAGQGVLFDTEHDCAELARNQGQQVLDSARDNPSGSGAVVPGDSRFLSQAVSERYDLLITSPPYPNRMSYIRELRPYMYWLDYLNNGRDAGDMDWSAIGGTWGIATSRLVQWQRSAEGFYPAYFDALLARVRNGDNKSGIVLSNYIAKYFEDMWCHVRDVAKVIVPGGTVHYVVGNSRFYNTVIPVDRLFADMLTEAGFKDARVTRIRKRNSKKELYEFDVSAIK
jgi:hypothetical protein